MSSDLLDYYNRELSYVRNLAREFSRANPDVAPRLGVEGEPARDPYVERMIEAFAFINARTRKKLDDDFPEIAEALLGVLYPQYLAPTPSMAIAQFTLDAGQGGLLGGYALARGTRLETEEVEGVACEYRTCFPLRLYPLRVAEAGIVPVAAAPANPQAAGATVAVRIKLTTYAPNVFISGFDPGTLRFFLAGEPLHANALYELLFNATLDVAVATGNRAQPLISLGRGCLSAVGFGADEGILPEEPRSFHGYNLLSEYFVLPEKFRFVDVNGLGGVWSACSGGALELFFYLRRTIRDVEHNVSARTFGLGCTPIVNLFDHPAEPIRLTHAQSRYRLISDARWSHAKEVYSVDRVTATTPDQRTIPIHPFYSTVHAFERQRQRVYFHPHRRLTGYRDGREAPGTEIDLTFVDLDFNPNAAGGWTVEAITTCLNRDLPAKLPFSAGHPRIRATAGGPLMPITCLTQPTPTYWPPLRHGTLWRLVSHLSLNHLSLVEGDKGAASFAEMLLLYEPVGSADRLAKIHGIRSLEARRSTALVTRGDAGLCRGTEIVIEFDEAHYADRSMFLFATVLERFFGLYCSINSFSQLAIRSRQRGEEVHRWPPRTGNRQLL